MRHWRDDGSRRQIPRLCHSDGHGQSLVMICLACPYWVGRTSPALDRRNLLNWSENTSRYDYREMLIGTMDHPVKLRALEMQKNICLKDGDIVISRAGSVGHSYLIKNSLKDPYLHRILFVPKADYIADKVSCLFRFLQALIMWHYAIPEKSPAAFSGAQMSDASKAKARLLEFRCHLFPSSTASSLVSKSFSTSWMPVSRHCGGLRSSSDSICQSVLKSAVEGRLQGMAEGASRGRAAAALLKRIGIKQTEFKQFCFEDDSILEPRELPNLPENWVWTRIGQIFDVYVGATPRRNKPEYWGGDIPWVSSGEVAFCRIHKTRETICQLGFENSSTKIHPPGTVLLGMIGEGKTRGQAAILEIAACNNQNSAAIRVSEVGLAPEFVYYYFEHEYERTRKLSSGNNQPALSKNRVQSMYFAAPA